MFNFLFDSTVPKRFGSVVVLATIFCLNGCADTAPVAKPEPDRYYLNGKASTKEAVEKIAPETIDRMDVLSGQQAIDYTHDASTKRAMLIQTK